MLDTFAISGTLVATSTGVSARPGPGPRDGNGRRGSATAAGAPVPARAGLLRDQARAPQGISHGTAPRRPGPLAGAARVPAPALVPAALILAALAPPARAALLTRGALAPLLVVPAAAALPAARAPPGLAAAVPVLALATARRPGRLPLPGRPPAASSSRRSVSEIRLRGMSTPSTRTRTTSPDFTIWWGSDTKVRDMADTCTRPS